MVNILKSLCSNKILLDRDLNQLQESFIWSGFQNFIIEIVFKIAIKQNPQHFQNSGLDVPKKINIFWF